MIVRSPTDLIFDDIFLELEDVAPNADVYLKLEGISITGSIKIKAALYMINDLMNAGVLKRGGNVIESSSGNLGLALSMVCAHKGLNFTCVSDPNISPQAAKLIKAYGSNLIVVTERDASGGYLGTRIDLIHAMQLQDPSLVWLNQYGNINNVEAHATTTGPSILKEFPNPDYVFIGAGTTGTLGGVSRVIRLFSPRTRIVAVDSVGSTTFGRLPAKRYIPGLGTSRPPAIREHSDFDELVMIKEEDTVRTCRAFAAKGVLLGGSSGTVITAIARYAPGFEKGAVVVAISPDLGDRYVDTIYCDDWVRQKLPLASLALAPKPSKNKSAAAVEVSV